MKLVEQQQLAELINEKELAKKKRIDALTKRKEDKCNEEQELKWAIAEIEKRKENIIVI